MKVILQTLVIISAACWIFWPVLHGDWLWDDDTDIVDNAITHSPKGLWSIWFQPGAQLDYYPVKASVQWGQWHLWGEDTFCYHLTNIVLHLAGALLVWRLFSKLGLRFAWLGGLLFAIHPTAVESVAWIAELKNTLSLPPFLLAMCFYLEYDEHHHARDYLLALGFFLFAMLCKTTMVMFPVVILLYMWWKRGRISWTGLKGSVPFFVISLVLGIVTLLVGGWYRQLHSGGAEVVPLGGFFSRFALAGVSLAFYFLKALWPIGLLPVYPQWPVSPPSLLQFLPWPILAAIFYWFWRQRQAYGRHALFGLGFFLIMLLPFVTMNFEGYATFTWVMNHFLYIPILGLIGLVIAGLEQIELRITPPLRIVGAGIIAGVLGLLAWQSHSYAGKFVDQETLWTYTLQFNPEAWPARNNLGKVLMQEGRVPEAIDNFREAVRLRPDFAEAMNNWGNALAKTGHLPEAVEHFQEALRIKPVFAEVHCNWGSALVRMGRLSEGIGHYQEALRDNPAFAPAHYDWGNALLLSGQYDEAIAHYQEALRLNPDYSDAHNNLGTALLRQGRTRDAIEQFQKTLSINPNDISARNNLSQMGLSVTNPGK